MGYSLRNYVRELELEDHLYVLPLVIKDLV